jgi:hypothetical protein
MASQVPQHSVTRLSLASNAELTHLPTSPTTAE